MVTSRETKQLMEQAAEHWRMPFMEFVDDFRFARDPQVIVDPFSKGNERFDAILASAIEYLGDELGVETPAWVWAVPAEPFSGHDFNWYFRMAARMALASE
jgi:hypothetical protein